MQWIRKGCQHRSPTIPKDRIAARGLVLRLVNTTRPTISAYYRSTPLFCDTSHSIERARSLYSRSTDLPFVLPGGTGQEQKRQRVHPAGFACGRACSYSRTDRPGSPILRAERGIATECGAGRLLAQESKCVSMRVVPAWQQKPESLKRTPAVNNGVSWEADYA